MAIAMVRKNGATNGSGNHREGRRVKVGVIGCGYWGRNIVRNFADLLSRRCAEKGLRTIVVTHHREHAAWLGETAIVLDSGRIAGACAEKQRLCWKI